MAEFQTSEDILFNSKQVTFEDLEKNQPKTKIDSLYGNELNSIYKDREVKAKKAQEEEARWVSNIVSPERVNEWKNKGSMTALEVWNKKDKNELMPFMGTWKEGTKSFKIKEISDKLQSGQTISPEERKQFEEFVLDMAEVQTRGYSFGGNVANIGLGTLPFMLEFGAGLLATGGTSSFGSASSKLAQMGIKKSLKRKIAEGIAKTTYNATLNPKTYAFSSTVLSPQVRLRMGDIMLSDSLAISPEGQAILKESTTSPAIALMKALALTNIEVASEMSGEMLVRPTMEASGKLAKVIASPVLKHLPKGFSEEFVKLAEQTTKLPFLKAVDSLGFNGVLEEMGEERVGDLLKTALEDVLEASGIQEGDGISFEQYLDALFPSAPELGAEAVSFALTGVGMNAVDKGIKSLPVAGEKYTKDGFLLDAGIFRVKGYDSYLDKKVKEELQKQGHSEEEIEETLHSATRDDKAQFLKNQNKEFDSKKEYDEKEFIKEMQRQDIEQKAYEKFRQGGRSEEESTFASMLMGNFFRKMATESEDSQKVFNKALENLEVLYNVPRNELSNVLNGATTHNQIIFDRKNIEDNFEDTPENITKTITYDIKNILEENDVMEDEFKFEDIRIYGSYATGKNKKSSDLDIIVQYSGSMREDTAFNMFHDKKLYLTNKDGKRVKIDINPINTATSGTIDDKLNQMSVLYQSAYHGTPHRFDKFSTEHIGSGEGNQAHGWGLYFAEDKKVSEGYFKRLSGDKVFYNGQELEKTYIYTHKIERGIDKETNRYLQDLRYIIDRISEIKSDENISLEEAKIKFIKNYEQKDKLLTFQRKILDIAKNLDVEKIELQKGQLYEVDIPDSDVLLDENKPLNEQPDKVKKAILEYYKSRPNDYIIPEDINSLSQQRGKEFYRDIAFQLERENSLAYRMANGLNTDIDENFNPEKEASLLLNSLGIKGITYDGKQDGRCYVIFDDKAVDVLKTYYQEAGEPEEEKLIAGYTYPEVLEKLTALYEEMGAENISAEKEKELMVKCQILEDAFEIAEGSDKFKNEEKNHQIMLNTYYIMNNQEIPNNFIEDNAESQRTYNDLVKLHREKKEKAESEYYGYYAKTKDKSYISLMENANPSTLIHELGHLFLDTLNDLARVDTNAREQLEAVNKWLGSNGEYTMKQAEKFARSFEAYLYNGKAPNNRLRTVFEQFKEWLKSVYTYVTDIPDADISPEVQELFDNMFSGDEYYEEKKQVAQLLKKLNSLSNHKNIQKPEEVQIPKNGQLTERQKKHKETAYDIIWYAVSHSKNKEGKQIVKNKKQLYMLLGNDQKQNRKNKGVIAQVERLVEFLNEIDDPFSANDGFLAEWGEFFTDTGVSYDNQVSGADAELVQQALDVILNNKYTDDAETVFDNYLNDRAEFYEKAIDDADLQYKALMRSFKKENRNVALGAYYEWIENLDAEIREDYEERFIYDSSMIEREENADKFELAKRRILDKALSLDSQFNISKSEKYKELVLETMKQLNFLTPSDKAKLTANILDVPSTTFLMSSLDNIMDIAKTMEDVNYRRNLERDIHKELQTTKNVKKNGRTVGKYDYKSNKIFEELRQLDRLSPERANELRLEASKFATAEDNGLSERDKLINKFLSYKAGGRTFADTELMKELYDEIVKIKLIGKTVKSEQELQDKYSEEKDVEELIKIVNSKKEANVLTKGYISGLGNLESTVNAIFNQNIKEKYASEVLYAETQSQAWQYKVKSNFEKSVAEIYNLPQWCWDKKIIEYLNEKHKYNEIRRTYDPKGDLIKTRSIERTLTKMDIIGAYIWSKNEVLEKRLKNQFGEDVLEEMLDELSIEDVKLAELLMRTAQSFYPLVNKTFIKKYGLDLPKVSCYFPSTPERGSEVDLYNEYSSKSLNNGFTKARSGSETQAMDFHNPVAILYSHIEGVSKFAFMSESLDKMNLRFKNNDLKRTIINKYGEDAYRTLEQALMNVTYKKEAPVFNGMNKVIDNMVGNWIQANVAVKPIVGLKQLLSANNYAVDMPYMTWQAGFLKALANPKETIDYMMNIPYIKARYNGSFSNEFLKQTVENSAFALSKKLKDSMNMFIKMGDIGAIIFGGKPYIEYLMKEKGMSEKQAIKQFILSTNRSQQSSAVSSLSNFQVNMTRNPMGKLFIAFKNSPQQYVRMCGDAIISVANGDMSKKQCAKILFQFGYLQPFLYAIATSGSLFRFLFTGDDDDLLKDMQMSIFNLNSNAVPLLGDIYLYALNRLAYKEKYLPQTTPLLGDIQQEINKISKEDVELADYLEFIGYCGLHVGLGYNSKAMTSMSSGVGDIVQGDIAKGSMKVLGYTDKRSKAITGDKEDK